MLNLPLPVRVYLCLEPTDMRRSFDGLCRMVREHVGADPLSGDLFVFRSKGDMRRTSTRQSSGSPEPRPAIQSP